MQWDMDELKLVVGSQRVQGGGPHYFACPDNGNGINNKCSSAIRCAKYNDFGAGSEIIILALFMARLTR